MKDPLAPDATTEWPRTEIMAGPHGARADPAAASTAQRQMLAAAPRIGAILLGRYRLVAVLGTGGMSVVYKALDQRRVEGKRQEPHVALKVLLLPAQDKGHALTLLQEEARKLEQLSHPGIVRVLDCDRDGDIVFMTMEYLSGSSVDRRLQTPAEPIDAQQARAIVATVGSALAAAHAAGVVHGDLKPGNVMLTATGEVKLIDFGIARAMGHLEPADAASTGNGGRHALTPRYASPEMLEGNAPEPIDDVHALATLAYELITGARPFGARDSLEARATGAMVEPSQRLGRGEYAAIARALTPERAQRTASVTQFLREFGAARSVRLPWLMAAAAAAVLGIAVALVLPRPPDTRLPAVVEPRADTPPAPALTPGQVFRDCPTCPLMMPLAAGQFLQGSADDDPEGMPSERPRHAVRLGRPFAMSVHEISLAEYREFRSAPGGTDAPAGGCEIWSGAWRVDDQAGWRDPGFPQSGADPVTCVSFDDAVSYARWLSMRTGHRYRLPTASEWEYAARAGSERTFAWNAGSQTPCQIGNVADASASLSYPGFEVVDCDDNRAHTAPVGTYAANAFGLHDLIGNVFEWVGDCWQPDYSQVQAPADGALRDAPDCTERELRGGSWFTRPAFLRPAYRNRFAAGHRASTTGIRLVREIDS